MFISVVVSSVSDGVDLSKQSVLASKKVSSSMTQQLLQQQQHPAPKNGSRTPISAEVYANLLMQLRQVAANEATSGGSKLTAAARKERLKCQPCFQCPVCKKR